MGKVKFRLSLTMSWMNSNYRISLRHSKKFREITLAICRLVFQVTYGVFSLLEQLKLKSNFLENQRKALVDEEAALLTRKNAVLDKRDTLTSELDELSVASNALKTLQNVDKLL